MRAKTLIVLLAACLAGPLAAAPSLLDQAQQKESSGDAVAAEKIYRQLIADRANDAVAWFGLARSLRSQGRAKDARKAFERAVQLDPTNFSILAGYGILEATQGNLDRANELLMRAADAGLPPTVLETHEGLKAVRATPAFAGIVRRAKQKAYPCETSPAHSAFDFWIGDWKIFSNGRQIGTNIITKEMNGCMIRERYSSAGGQGESLNFLDPRDGRWKQTWVSSNGGVTHYVGSPLQKGVMAMEGSNASPGSKPVRERARWTAEAGGMVRHVVEISEDEGATWKKAFDGEYVRSVPASAAVASAADAAPDPATLEQSIIAMEKESWAAWERHDTTFWENYLSDDHVEVHAAPRLAEKKEVVTHIGSRACVVSDYKLDNFTFRQVGPDTALLIYRAAQTTKCGSHSVPSPVWATSLFQRRDGRWVNVLYGHTPFPPPSTN